MIEVMSIGYEHYTPAGFFARLAREGVECLIDVRNVAMSRKRGFSKKALEVACDQAGIVYVHLQKLGNPKELREQIRHGLSVDEWKAQYASHLATQEEDFAELVRLVTERRSCLMCLEHSHTVCHRDVILQKLRRAMPEARVTFLE